MTKITDEGQAWLNVLARIRKTITEILEKRQCFFHQGHSLRRQARKLLTTGNRFDERRAERLNQQADGYFEKARELNPMLINAGRLLMQSARSIDEIPQAVMLDFLGVNQADRHKVNDDGFIDLTFIKALEYSVASRGSDSASGPFHDCIAAFMQHELMTNNKLQESAEEMFFGDGGLFENLPRYRQAANGDMVREQPRLRLVK